MTFRSMALLLFWLLQLGLPSAHAASPADALMRALDVLKAQPAQTKGLDKGSALAAEVSPEGHWTFVNPAGERFTSASPDELKRVVPALAPDASKSGVRLVLMVTEDSVFRQRQHFLALSLAADRRTDVFVAVDNEAYPILRRGERGKEQLAAEIRPNLLVELSERRLFDEAVWQLAHPLKRSQIRVLAVEPGGAEQVSASPRLDPQTKRALTDQVSPAGLDGALRALARQTVLITARRDGDLLAFRPSSGPEHIRPLKDVLAAAEAADVNLVILQTSNPRQPGARSWWWGSISVGRLDDALGRDHLADFLNAIASPQSKLLVGAQDDASGRIRLSARPLRDESSPRTGIGDALSELASNIVGQVVVSGVEASLRDRARETELDRRVVPFVPSAVQWIYAGLLALGLMGHGTASRWWARIWPAERREGYGGPFGYMAARAVRGVVYTVLFMPLVAVASAPLTAMRLLTGRAKSETTAAPV
jgi:hypothetical protein